MPLTSASFTATQSMAAPETITFTDTSEGTDGTLTNRKIVIRLPNGNWLDSDGNESSTIVYIDWDYADTSIVLDILSRSTAAYVQVLWYAGATQVYNSDEEFCWNFFDYEFALQILQGQTSNPGIVQDTTYYNNFLQFIVNIFNSENAIRWGGDTYSSQGAMNRNYLMIQNENFFF